MGRIESEISDGFVSNLVLSEEALKLESEKAPNLRKKFAPKLNSCKYYTESVPYIRKQSFNKSLTKYISSASTLSKIVSFERARRVPISGFFAETGEKF